MISKALKEAIKSAAEKLSAENAKITLAAPFNGIYVSLEGPTEESLKKTSQETRFQSIGINREGSFFFVIERLWGKKE